MLVGDRAKYFGIVAGITFAALLIAQQLSIFCGLLLRTTSQLQDIAEADIWVMDPNVEYVDELKPMKEDYLQRVQGVHGVAWAVHFYKGQARLKLGDGKYQQAIVLGIDDATMVGAPQKIVLGSLADLRQPDAVIMDENGYKYLWPHEPLRIGRLLEMNDHRAVLVGICRSSRTFQTFPILYTRYSLALEFIPQERRVMPFVLGGADAGCIGDGRLRSNSRADRAIGHLARRFRLGNDLVLHEADRHSDQFRHHRRARLHRRLRDRGANVLHVRHRESESIRGTEGDGREQSADCRHGADSGSRGRADRV